MSLELNVQLCNWSCWNDKMHTLKGNPNIFIMNSLYCYKYIGNSQCFQPAMQVKSTRAGLIVVYYYVLCKNATT